MQNKIGIISRTGQYKNSSLLFLHKTRLGQNYTHDYKNKEPDKIEVRRIVSINSN